VNTAVLFSSAKDDWQTPLEIFQPLCEEFDLCVDVAATHENSLRLDYFGPDNSRHPDALAESWAQFGTLSRCWCNPPYSRGLQAKFIAKASLERVNGVTTVMLLPARTDTKAFHAHIWNAKEHRPYRGVEVRFLPGRIKFIGAKHGAPFPSMIIVFRGAQL
jgi:phage N-6-adenine-methyltransferase